MTSWRDEYAEALLERDRREKASYQKTDDELIAAFTSLLERTTALEAEKAANFPSTSPETSKPPPASKTQTTGPTDESTAQTRKDLAEALRSNTTLQSRTRAAETELQKLRSKVKSDAKIIEDLSKERATLSQKLKDRDEEIKCKTKLVADFQDEQMTLELQLNVSEQKVKSLKDENKELIDRWMARKGREAEEMNRILDQPDRR